MCRLSIDEGSFRVRRSIVDPDREYYLRREPLARKGQKYYLRREPLTKDEQKNALRREPPMRRRYEYEQENGHPVAKMVAVGGALLAGYMLYHMLPDLLRYMRMKSM